MDHIHFLERSTKLQEAPRSQIPWSMPSESLLSIKSKLLGELLRLGSQNTSQSSERGMSLNFWCSLETTKSCCPELSSLSIPFREAFDINFADRDFSLLAKPQFHLSPPVPKKVPKWSLDHALEISPNTKVSEQLSVPVRPFS